METVLLVLLAMTAVWRAAGVTITAPRLVGRDLQQPQQQQQAMISIMVNNRSRSTNHCCPFNIGKVVPPPEDPCSHKNTVLIKNKFIDTY